MTGTSDSSDDLVKAGSSPVIERQRATPGIKSDVDRLAMHPADMLYTHIRSSPDSSSASNSL